MMKQTASYITCACLLASAFSAAAYADNSYVTRARVLESIPLVETVYEEREVCRYKYATERRRQRRDTTGEKLIGGVLGGVAGSTVGKGSGRDAAAGVGALLGSEIASQDGELTGGELIGGIAGGIIGNQVGGGSGKTAATAAGVLLGSIVGDNVQNGDRGASANTNTRQKVRVCDIEEFPKKVITGYEVTFEYDGVRFSQILTREPGDYVNVNINVDALEERTGGLH